LQVLVTLARTIGLETPGGVELQITNEEFGYGCDVEPYNEDVAEPMFFVKCA
jgi:hypothetical protein